METAAATTMAMAVAAADTDTYTDTSTLTMAMMSTAICMIRLQFRYSHVRSSNDYGCDQSRGGRGRRTKLHKRKEKRVQKTAEKGEEVANK